MRTGAVCIDDGKMTSAATGAALVLPVASAHKQSSTAPAFAAQPNSHWGGWCAMTGVNTTAVE